MLEIALTASVLALGASALLASARIRRLEQRPSAVPVQRLEITISSALPPGEIARRVVDQITRLPRRPRPAPTCPLD